MFGVLEEGEESLAGRVLRVRREGSWRVYERLGGDGSVEASARVAAGVRILLLPYPPFLIPFQELLNCLYLRLESQVVIPDGAAVEFSVALPYDYAVVAASGGTHNLVDVFPSESGPPKMAVYGDLLEGMLCRYYKTSVDPAKPPPGAAIAKVEVVNEAGLQVVFSRIVTPRRGLRLLYEPRTGDVVASSVKMRIKGPGEAEVWLEEPYPPEGYASVPVVEREKRLLEALSARMQPKISMSWGL